MLFRTSEDGARFLIAQGAFQEYRRRPDAFSSGLFAAAYRDLIKANSKITGRLYDEEKYQEWEAEWETKFKLLERVAAHGHDSGYRHQHMEPEKIAVKQQPSWKEIQPKRIRDWFKKKEVKPQKPAK